MLINKATVVACENKQMLYIAPMALGKRLAYALEHRKKNQAWLAKQTGVDPQAINALIQRDSQRSQFASMFATALNINLQWLLDGQGAMSNDVSESSSKALKPSGTYNVEPGPDIQGLVPLLSWVQAGAWVEAVNPWPINGAEDWLQCPVAHSNRTYVLRVRGISMENPIGRPSFHEGELIFVDSYRTATNKDFVIVRLDDRDETTFKQLIVEEGRRYLKALNPAWPEQVIEINGNATICGVVIFKGEKF